MSAAGSHSEPAWSNNADNAVARVSSDIIAIELVATDPHKQGAMAHLNALQNIKYDHWLLILSFEHLAEWDAWLHYQRAAATNLHTRLAALAMLQQN